MLKSLERKTVMLILVIIAAVEIENTNANQSYKTNKFEPNIDFNLRQALSALDPSGSLHFSPELTQLSDDFSLHETLFTPIVPNLMAAPDPTSKEPQPDLPPSPLIQFLPTSAEESALYIQNVIKYMRMMSKLVPNWKNSPEAERLMSSLFYLFFPTLDPMAQHSSRNRVSMTSLYPHSANGNQGEMLSNINPLSRHPLPSTGVNSYLSNPQYQPQFAHLSGPSDQMHHQPTLSPAHGTGDEQNRHRLSHENGTQAEHLRKIIVGEKFSQQDSVSSVLVSMAKAVLELTQQNNSVTTPKSETLTKLAEFSRNFSEELDDIKKYSEITKNVFS